MSNLYYVITTLPAIKLNGEKPLLSHEELLLFVKSFLSETEWLRISEFLLDRPPQSLAKLHKFEKDFWNWEISLRNELAIKRAEALQVKLEIKLIPSITTDEPANIAKTAFNMSNPLETEIFLHKCRWDLLENLKGLKAFEFEALLAYAMQVQIATIKSHLNLEAGKENYRKQYEKIMENAQTVLMENI